MKKSSTLSRYSLVTIASSLMLLTGCVTEKLNTPPPKQTKIGVISLLGNSQFVLDYTDLKNERAEFYLENEQGTQTPVVPQSFRVALTKLLEAVAKHENQSSVEQTNILHILNGCEIEIQKLDRTQMFFLKKILHKALSFMPLLNWETEVNAESKLSINFGDAKLFFGCDFNSNVFKFDFDNPDFMTSKDSLIGLVIHIAELIAENVATTRNLSSQMEFGLSQIHTASLQGIEIPELNLTQQHISLLLQDLRNRWSMLQKLKKCLLQMFERNPHADSFSIHDISQYLN